MEWHVRAGGRELYQERIFPIPFLKHGCLKEAISYKYKIFLSDLVQLFLLGHLNTKFIKNTTVFLVRGRLRIFLLRIHEKILPSLVQRSSTDLRLRNFGSNSERYKQQAKSKFMQKSSQGSCLFYIILPAVQRCSNKTKHAAEERIRAQQNCSMAEFFPWEGRGIGSPSWRSCCGTQYRAARPRS